MIISSFLTRVKILFTFLILISFKCISQDYKTNYNSWKETYINDFKTSERSPLKKSELKYLRFFPPDSTWNIAAKFRMAPDEKPFEIPTSSGKTKTYIKYGILSFEIKGQPFSLCVYKMVRPKDAPVGIDYMFVPFKDFTNGEITYGGGRYIEFTLADFQKEVVYIDFNKAYNPYCAYTSGYSCPIPPDENYLKVEVTAGEKNFAGKGH